MRPVFCLVVENPSVRNLYNGTEESCAGQVASRITNIVDTMVLESRASRDRRVLLEVLASFNVSVI